MKTYIATSPASWLQIHEPTGEIESNGKIVTRNIVVGYRMTVNADETAYDSFYQTDDGRWHPYSTGKPLSEYGRRGLLKALAAGSLRPE
jgi:threonine dehydrogenase-like Zn-dependent dehydrogenase